MNRRHAAAVAAVLALLWGCGDDEGGTGSSSAPATTGAPSSAAATTAASGAATTTAPPATADPDIDPAVTLTEVAGLEAPVDLAWRPGDDGRYVAEQVGRVTRLATDGSTTVVLDISERTDADGERGLLGLTFAPAGDLAYINYTDEAGDTVVAEYPVGPDGGFDGGAARTVLTVDQPYSNHNGGDLTFGPDALLYVGMGDGGDAGDPERRATDPSSLLGKLLRIDPAPSGDLGYTVPPDNPFVGQAGTRPEIWASGLRNPWRFSFDRTTGDLWIADVGQSGQEEVDVAPAADGTGAGRGLSFGWSAFEGTERYNDDVPADGHTPPIHTYSHADGGCSISGGVRARGGPVAELAGWYVFGDFCAGTVWALQVLGEGPSLAAGRVVELGELPGLTAVAEGPEGELYALSQQGPVVRLDPA